MILHFCSGTSFHVSVYWLLFCSEICLSEPAVVLAKYLYLDGRYSGPKTWTLPVQTLTQRLIDKTQPDRNQKNGIGWFWKTTMTLCKITVNSLRKPVPLGTTHKALGTVRPVGPAGSGSYEWEFLTGRIGSLNLTIESLKLNFKACEHLALIENAELRLSFRGGRPPFSILPIKGCIVVFLKVYLPKRTTFFLFFQVRSYAMKSVEMSDWSS